MHSEKSNVSNPAHHLAQNPCQLVGSLLHTQQALCQDACPGVTGTVAAQNNVSEAEAVASGAKVAKVLPWGQLLCRFISLTLRQVPEGGRGS